MPPYIMIQTHQYIIIIHYKYNYYQYNQYNLTILHTAFMPYQQMCDIGIRIPTTMKLYSRICCFNFDQISFPSSQYLADSHLASLPTNPIYIIRDFQTHKCNVPVHSFDTEWTESSISEQRFSTELASTCWYDILSNACFKYSLRSGYNIPTRSGCFYNGLSGHFCAWMKRMRKMVCCRMAYVLLLQYKISLLA